MPWNDKDALTPQALNSRSGAVFNVKDPDFGATGDGVTDDTVAIQAAIDAVPADVADAFVNNRGGIVYLPEGTYIISSTIELKSGVALVGDGAQATQLLYTKTTGDVIHFLSPTGIPTYFPTIRLKGFRVKVDASLLHTSGAGINLQGVNTTNRQIRPELEDLYVGDTAVGFRFGAIQGGFIKHCICINIKDKGFLFEIFSTLLHVTDCWVGNATGVGWTLTTMTYCTFTACGVDLCGDSGWVINGARGCFFNIGSEGNTGTEVLLTAGDGSHITGRILPGGNTVNGLSVVGTNSLLITMHIDTAAAPTGAPLIVDSPSVNISVIGGFIGTYNSGANRLTGNLSFFVDSSSNFSNGTSSAPIITLLTTGTGISGTGMSLFTEASNGASRNWAIMYNAVVFGDFAIRQSNARLGNPITAGTDRFTISPTGAVGMGDLAPTGVLSQATITTLADAATPSVSAGNLFKTGGTTPITDFDDGVVGQTIKILAAHSVKITDGAPIILAGGADYDMTDSDTLTLTMYDDQVWQEDSRSVN